MIKLQVHKLHKRYARKVIIRELSFEQEGGVLGIAGPNGSGKSTLLKCLAYLLKTNGGAIGWQVDGRSVERPDFNELLGYLAPYVNLYAELTCFENLEFILRLRTLFDHGARIQPLLEQMQMGDRADQPFGSLSTGQQQRIKLASALVHRPRILFLDEPGSNLDAAGRNLVRSVIDDFRNDRHLVLVASNNPEELAWCDRMISVEEEAPVN